MKSILLLGGSRQQVVAIETAKRLGYRTVLCDYLDDNPGQYVADVFYRESTTDLETMLGIARRESVSGVLAYASDPAALTAAYISEEMGLPGNPLSSVRILSTKHLFRSHLREHGFNCPRSAPLDSSCGVEELLLAAHDMTVPLVVKPTDSSGSKGVSVIDVRSEEALGRALEYARSFSRNGIILVEEYIRSAFPRVIGGDIFVVDGEVAFWGLMSCLRDESGGGLVPIGERYPSGMTARQESAVKDELSRLVDSLGIRFGELNVEVIIGEGDRPFVLELGARAGGNMIPIQLSDISGVDLVEANVRYAMGDQGLDIGFSGRDAAYATYVLHAGERGVFEGADVSDALSRHVYRTVMYHEVGDSIEAFDGANKALGIVFLRFDCIEQMERALEHIGDDIRVRVEAGSAR